VAGHCRRFPGYAAGGQGVIGISEKQGCLISVEGIDGAGKTTLVGIIAEKLKEEGVPARVVREPGGTLLSEKIRALLLHKEPGEGPELAYTAEALLYAAARAQLVAEVIAPALSRGEVVLCDRFTDSTLAYQGGGRGLNIELLRAVNSLATGGLTPCLTLLLDLAPAAGRMRLKSRGQENRAPADRLETESELFYTRVRQFYLELAAKEPQRVVRLDAERPLEEVAEKAWAAVKKACQRASGGKITCGLAE